MAFWPLPRGNLRKELLCPVLFPGLQTIVFGKCFLAVAFLGVGKPQGVVRLPITRPQAERFVAIANGFVVLIIVPLYISTTVVG